MDTERFITISRIRLTFAQPAAYKLRIEVSDDQRAWRPVADLTANDRVSATIDITAPPNTTGRFVRLSFVQGLAAPTAQLSEVELVGALRNR